MNDRDLIDAFVTHLREHGHPDLQVDSWPEDDNRNSPDIDAVAGAFAIECTSIDTLPNQRRDSDWFFQAVDGLQKELRFRLTFRLYITLEYGALRKGQDWAAIRHGLKDWVIEKSLQEILDNALEFEKYNFKKPATWEFGKLFYTSGEGFMLDAKGRRKLLWY
jgi:hypothetical protein